MHLVCILLILGFFHLRFSLLFGAVFASSKGFKGYPARKQSKEIPKKARKRGSGKLNVMGACASNRAIWNMHLDQQDAKEYLKHRGT